MGKCRFCGCDMESEYKCSNERCIENYRTMTILLIVTTIIGIVFMFVLLSKTDGILSASLITLPVIGLCCLNIKNKLSKDIEEIIKRKNYFKAVK
ncbi:MAG: hypothetical protein GY804_11380 [Alphaproteobacteria bacterium]|nr:hypothetical protein [Alphaproteobacteria bacterium]